MAGDVPPPQPQPGWGHYRQFADGPGGMPPAGFAYSPPPGPLGESRPWYGHRWAIALVAFVVGTALGSIVTGLVNNSNQAADATSVKGGAGTQAAPPANSEKPTQAPATTKKPAPASVAPPTPKPDGTYTSSCDYVLGNFTDNTSNGFRFIADALMHNTGNIGTVNVIRAAWFQAGGSSLTRTKKVKVASGHSLRAGITVPGTQDQIDLIQALSGKDCRVTVSIVDTYGVAQ